MNKKTSKKGMNIGEKFCWGGIVASIAYFIYYISYNQVTCWVPIGLIGYINLYLIVALIYATVLSKKKAEGKLESGTSKMPHRLPALVMLVCYVAALILCFASIYLNLGNKYDKIVGNKIKIQQLIHEKDSLVSVNVDSIKTIIQIKIDRLRRCDSIMKKEYESQIAGLKYDTVRIKEVQIKIDTLSGDSTFHFSNKINSKFDAFYFSMATMFTLGYTDTYPISKKAKWAVICQLISLFVLLFGAFPLLISRLADFTMYKAKEVKDVNNLVEAYRSISDTGISFEIKKESIDAEMKKKIIQYSVIKLAPDCITVEELKNKLRDVGYTNEEISSLDEMIANVIKIIGKKE